MSGEQAFALLVGLFCVSIIGLAALFVFNVVTFVIADRVLSRDKGDLGPVNKCLEVSKRISDPLTLAVYGCVGIAVLGFPQRFDALVGSHLSLTVAVAIFILGSGVIQILLGRALHRKVRECDGRKGSEL